jgi:hypothetical protein
MAARVDLLSPLRAEECRRRLREQTASVWMILSSAPIVGRIGETSLRLRKRIWYSNSFQTWLSAELVDEGSRTRLRCRFGLHPFTRIFTAIWFSGVVLIGSTVFVGTMAAWLQDRLPLTPQNLIGLLVPPGMLAVGILTYSIGRFFARNERRFLLEFLRDTIGAKDVAPLTYDGT